MRTEVRALILLCLLGFVFSGCQKNPEPAEEKLWSTSLDQALTRAARESKPILIDFGADWCKPCKRMHDEVFVDASIDKRLHTEFVPVLVDATEMTPKISALIKKYRVSTLPTVVFLNSKGQLLNDQSLVGFTNVEALNAQLSQVIKLTSRP